MMTHKCRTHSSISLPDAFFLGRRLTQKNTDLPNADHLLGLLFLTSIAPPACPYPISVIKYELKTRNDRLSVFSRLLQPTRDLCHSRKIYI